MPYNNPCQYLKNIEKSGYYGYKYVADYANKYYGMKILDVGCGTGKILDNLHKQNAIIHGIDISEQMVAYSKDKYDEVFNSPIETFKTNNTYDMILSAGVIDETNWGAPVESYNRIISLLEKDGIFITTICHANLEYVNALETKCNTNEITHIESSNNFPIYFYDFTKVMPNTYKVVVYKKN